MGIFNSKKKPKIERLGVKATEVSPEVTVIEGKMPEGFDPADPTQLKELVAQALKEAGAPAKVVEAVAGAEVKRFDKSKGGKLEGVALFDDLIVKLIGASTGTPKQVPVPQDPLKAEYVNALNRLHLESHKLGGAAAALVSSLKCLYLQGQSLTGKDAKNFAGFSEATMDAITAVGKLGAEVCALAGTVKEMGIPLPDVSTLTVN